MKIGHGVGIACGVMLVCAAVGLLVYRRRLRHLRSTPGTIRTTENQSVAGVVIKAELGGDSYVHKIGGKQVVAEADNMHARRLVWLWRLWNAVCKNSVSQVTDLSLG
jgi:hypothetical protein